MKFALLDIDMLHGSLSDYCISASIN